MRGGRRFGASEPRHRDGAPPRRATRPPPPPEGIPEAERLAWIELRGQVTKARTYDRTRLSAFKLTVRALALVYEAPADLKPTSLRGLIESASRMLGRFGLDPIGALQAERGPPPRTKADRELDEYFE